MGIIDWIWIYSDQFMFLESHQTGLKNDYWIAIQIWIFLVISLFIQIGGGGGDENSITV